MTYDKTMLLRTTRSAKQHPVNNVFGRSGRVPGAPQASRSSRCATKVPLAHGGDVLQLRDWPTGLTSHEARHLLQLTKLLGAEQQVGERSQADLIPDRLLRERGHWLSAYLPTRSADLWLYFAPDVVAGASNEGARRLIAEGGLLPDS